MKLKKYLIDLYEKIYTSDYIINKIYIKKNKDYCLKIMSSLETINYIEQMNCSITRFGEGEFELILDPKINLGFQNHSEQLKERLLEVLTNNDKNLLICIPYALNTIKGRTHHSRMFWFNWGLKDNQHHRMVEIIRKCNSNNYIFGDTQITRPYIAYKNKKNSDEIFSKLKGIWNDKDIIIVEGEKTRLGIGNDLLENVKSVKRILAPSTNAFDVYDKILDKVCNVQKDELVLIALGPTATVLAYDLSKKGIRALDIGHLDIEYEWFLNGAKDHDLVQGKYTNEATGGNNVSDCIDEKYVSSIVAVVK